jgi:Tol biopolymer transport system component
MRLPQNISLRLLDLAPDGQKLLALASHNEADLGMLELTAGGAERVLTTQAGLEYAPYPGPQGETVLFHVNQQESEAPDLRLSELWQWSPTQGTQAERLATQAFAPQWSPDGQQIAALLYTPPQSYDLQVLPVAGGPARTIARQLTFQGFTPRVPLQLAQPAEFTWHPDSQRLIYGENGGTLKCIHIVTQDEQILAQLPGWRLIQPTVAPNAHRVAWVGVRNQREWGVWTIPLEASPVAVTEPTVLYQTNDVLRLLGWRNETEMLIALVSNVGLNRALPTEIRVCTLSLTGELRDILQLPQSYLPSVQLTPDARSVVYVQTQQGRDVIAQTELKSGASHLLLNNPDPRVFFASPTWSKDGQRLYFSRQRQSYRLIYLQNLDLN